jgi:thymidylate synthase
MNTHWRSRDLFGAWEANINGMFQIAGHVAQALDVPFGEYFDFCDSLHVYGRKKLIFKEVVPLLERVKNHIKTSFGHHFYDNCSTLTTFDYHSLWMV